MGGINETVGKQKTVTPDGQTKVVGSVRYHEKQGQIHFHDDVNKLKVTVSVAEWMETWDKIETGETCHIFDPEWNTCLTIKTVMVPPKETSCTDLCGKSAIKDVALRIQRVVKSEDYVNLEAFSTK